VLRARLATAAVAIPLLLLLIFKGPDWLFAAVVGILAVLGVIEYSVLAFPSRSGERFVGILLGALLAVGAVASAGPSWLPAAVITSSIFAGFAYYIATREDFDRAVADLGINLIGALYVGFLLPHFVWLRNLDEGPGWVAFVLAVTMAGDSSGYFVGHAVGRHRLVPKLSPGKTVEGAIGILVGSLCAAVVGKAIFLQEPGYREAALLGLVMGVLGQLGDLSESALKRSFGTKESGWIFPGHGGVLDRIDSLLFPVSFLYYYLALAD
jgi:phosphatidate cytidylyltransferase